MRNLLRPLILAIVILCPASAFPQVLYLLANGTLGGPGVGGAYLDTSPASLAAYQGEGLEYLSVDDGLWVFYAGSYTGLEWFVSAPDYNTFGASFSSPGTKTLYFDVVHQSSPVAVQLYVAPSGNGLNLVCKQCQLQGGAPLNISTGNVWVQEQDYSVPGLGGGLTVVRTWNSEFQSSGPANVAGMFGQSWRSTYEESLSFPNSANVIYRRGDGSSWMFTYNSILNNYSLTSPPDERAQLVMNPVTGVFTITFPDGTQKVFNTQNLLSALIDRNNNQTTLGYDSSNRLISVTSPGGNTLTFSYDNANSPMQTTSAQDSVGTVATYTYDSSSRLTQVLYPDGSQYNFSYDSNSNILNVTDSQGKLLEAHTYGPNNNGLTSTQAYGVNSVSLLY